MLRNIKSRLYGSALPFIAADRVKVRMQEQKIDGRSAASHSAVFSLFTDVFSTHTFQERLSCPKMLNDGYNSARKRGRFLNRIMI